MASNDGLASSRTVRVRKNENDPDSVAPMFWQGTHRMPPPGIAGNRMRTNKYTIITFLPLNLFWQFRRLFNVYWLLQCVVVLIPGMSPTSPATTIAGFVFVLGVSAIKDAYEDYQRYKSDKAANNTIVEVMRGGVWKEIASMYLLVGDIVKVNKEQVFPADLLFLSACGEGDECMVETSNLDGERNLKRFRPMKPTTQYASAETLNAGLECTALVEPPNERLYKFNGQMRVAPNMAQAYRRRASDTAQMQMTPDGQTIFPINAENVLLRGARLKQTEHIHGLVVYAGMESKLQKNANKPRSKFSQIEMQLNKFIAWLFFINILLCVALTVGSVIEFPKLKATHWYFDDGFGQSQNTQFQNIATFFVLLNSIIPLSLVVSMELAVLFQALFMMWDDDMRDPVKGGMTVMTSGLNSELGLIEYVLCDKTGTLTQNKMEFKYCSAGGSKYMQPMSGELRSKGADEATFMRCLALCHEVFVDNNPPADKAEGTNYMYSSPDEVALVHAAAANGFKLIARGPNSIRLLEEGAGAMDYEVMGILEFSSERRRMGIIVRAPGGEISLIIKGADSALLPLCRNRTPPEIMRKSMEDLTEFANMGHRVMLVCQRQLTPQECNTYLERYRAASNLLQGREEALDNAYNSIERDMTCVGVTCVEDKLQDRVPETVQYLLKAGMHVWILTGDKLETAITIAYSSSIIQRDMDVTVIDATEWNEVASQLRKCLSKIQANPAEKRALVIGGVALELAKEKALVELVQMCEAFQVVVCARCAPAQKAQMVRLIMDELGKITLGIGDGGNDVPMITTAHVGVGIMGNEGMQAARAADYSIAEYKMLQKLVSVHGRYSNLRISDLIKYSFYKNVTFAIPQIVLNFYSSYSAQSFHNSWVILGFNIVFTGLPPIALAIFERDLSEDLIGLYPEAYSTEERRNPLNLRRFLEWQSHALYQGVLIALFILYGLRGGDTGGNVGLDHAGLLLGITLPFAVSLKMIVLIRSWNWITHFFLWGCLAATAATIVGIDYIFCPSSFAFSNVEPIQGCGVVRDWLYLNPRSYALFFVMLGACVGVDLACSVYQRFFNPHEWQKLESIRRLRKPELLRQEAPSYVGPGAPPPSYVGPGAPSDMVPVRRQIAVHTPPPIVKAEPTQWKDPYDQREIPNSMNIDQFDNLLQNLYGFDAVKQDVVEYDKFLQKLYKFDGITQDALVHPPPQRLPAAIGAPPQGESTAYYTLEQLYHQQQMRQYYRDTGINPWGQAPVLELAPSSSYNVPSTSDLVFASGPPQAGKWHPPGQNAEGYTAIPVQNHQQQLPEIVQVQPQPVVTEYLYEEPQIHVYGQQAVYPELSAAQNTQMAYYDAPPATPPPPMQPAVFY